MCLQEIRYWGSGYTMPSTMVPFEYKLSIEEEYLALGVHGERQVFTN